jgi:TonB family protein
MKLLLRLAALALLFDAARPAIAQDVVVSGPVAVPGEPSPYELAQPRSRLRPRYPSEMRGSSELGYVIISRYVDAKGKSLSLSATGTHLPYQRAVEEEFDGWDFKPAKRGDKSVDSSVWIAVIFNPKSAAANSPDATPRLLSVAPVLTPHRPTPDSQLPVVAMALSIDANGTVKSATPRSKLDGQTLAAIQACVQTWRFAPARRNGQPIASEIVLPVLCMPTPKKRSGPSVPPKVTRQTGPVYPFAMLRFGLTGEVKVDFVVDERGQVQNATIVSSNNPEFDTAALEAVRDWKFEPGTRDGHPVTTHMQVPVIFTLDDHNGREVFQIEEGDHSKLPPELQYDTPPQIKNVQIPVYPYPALRNHVVGKAEVRILIGENGRVGAVKILSAEQPEFGLALVAAAEGFVFDPALKSGKPVPYVLKLNQSFSRFELHDYSGDELLALEQKHPERIAGANTLDAPLKPISRRAPIFPVAVGRDIHDGEAVLECLIDKDGHARLPRIISASDPAFGYAAAQALNAWWFEPAKQNGKAVVTRVRIPFKFSDTSAKPKPSGRIPPPKSASVSE